MNVNKVIHEAMGGSWKEQYNLNFNPRKPEYTDPVNYCALMDWMREEHNNSYKFKMWLNAAKDISTIYHWLFLSRQEQVNLIAEAIEAGVFK